MENLVNWGVGLTRMRPFFEHLFPELLKLISLFVTRRWLQMRRYQTRATRYIKNYQSTETLRHQPHSLPTLFDDKSQSQH